MQKPDEFEQPVDKSPPDNHLHFLICTGFKMGLHRKFALTFMNVLLRLLPSTVERVGTIILSQSKVD